MEQARLPVQFREGKGKGYANAIRRTGAVPAIVYGHKMAPITIQFYEQNLRRVLASGGENVIISMDLGGENPETVIVKEVQIHPVSRRILHADFVRVSLEERITTHVPITLIGTALGISAGGILEFMLREVRVECQVGNIPDHIEVDVSSLEIGHYVRVGEIKPIEGLTILDDPATTIVTVAAPAIVEQEIPEAAVAAEQTEEMEPEVISAKRKEEAEEEEEK